MTRPLVLIVDDDAAAVRAAELLLEAGGMTAVGATSAEEALKLLEGGFRPQVIVVDMLLPGMDGNEFTRRLRAMPDVTAKVIAATGWAQLVQPETESIATELVEKPVGGTELLDAVRRALGGEHGSPMAGEGGGPC